MTARARSIPRTTADAIYERVIEAQETLAEIAKEQTAAGVARDQVLSKIGDTMGRLADAMTSISDIVKSHDLPIRDTVEGVESIPEIAERNLKATAMAIDIHDKRMAKRLSRLVWWVSLGALLGNLAGNGAHELIGQLLHTKPF